ncbi:hypothetical protein [Inquilinus sp. Marseille-Q2685]|uniref:hypothetical protein n=1 Tax=Inquilinus sp. Marseille-Q2685 TaxID=2866581 RepID=UPI001CE3D387|nr:hypothetical protein [Inquilinus sp. Marseille-Q2685]
MANPAGFLAEFSDDVSGLRLVIEDDGRVCYGYLISPDGIIGDVWLYNRGAAPSEPEWDNPERAPFANPAKLSKTNLPYVIPNSSDAFKVHWEKDEGVSMARIYIDEVLGGILAPGDKPGQSAAACADGPLARVIGT